MAGILRNPRALLMLGGSTIELLSAQISLSTLGSSDTAHVDFPLYVPGFDPAVLDGDDDIPMVLSIVGDGNGGGLLFTGKVTQDSFNFGAGTVTVQGEDKSADLLKKRSREAFKNKKGGEVAEEIGKRHGLTVEADAATIKAGKTFQIDYNMLTDHSEMQVLRRIAEREGLSLVIDKANQTLTFKRGDDDDLPVFPIRYSPPSPDGYATSDAIEVRSVRNHKIKGKTKVNVLSWNTKSKKAITSNKDSGGGGEGATYDYRVPNLTQEQADRVAERKLSENTSHEMSIEIEMPGDVSIPARSKIDLTGTGTSRDQIYITDTISHRIGFGEGWLMTITGKNKKSGKGKS